MPVAAESMKLMLLAPMATFIMYYDVRYRRIPNALVLMTLIGGLAINTSLAGFQGTISSLEVLHSHLSRCS
jgi:Flp pilus assembly protein protease CpaA